MNSPAQQRLERLWRWRTAAVWAPIVWFPAVVFAILADRAVLAVAVGLSGLIFAGWTRAMVWRARCPACGRRLRDGEAGFRRFWDAAACADCGISLFALRRGEASGAGRPNESNEPEEPGRLR